MEQGGQYTATQPGPRCFVRLGESVGELLEDGREETRPAGKWSGLDVRPSIGVLDGFVVLDGIWDGWIENG